MSRKLHFQVSPAHDFEKVATQWADLNRTLTGNHPFLDPRFVGALLRYRGSVTRPEHLRLVFAYDGDRPVAALVLERIAPTVWQLFRPDQAVIAPAITDRNWFLERSPGDLNRVAGEFLGALTSQALGRVSVVQLTAQDPLVSPWPTMATAGTFEQRFHARTVAIDTQGGFEAYWGGRSKALRKEIRRHLDRLTSTGMSPSMSVVSEPTSIAGAVDDYARIESAGWKGAAGTAVTLSGLQHAFYREVMTSFATDGTAAIYQLHLGNRVVASQMTLRQAGMRVILKTTFDEQFRGYGVGRVADYLGYQLMFSDATTRSIEFYTDASDDDMRWVTSERTIVNVLWYSSKCARLGTRVARNAKAWLLKSRSRQASRIG